MTLRRWSMPSVDFLGSIETYEHVYRRKNDLMHDGHMR